MAESLKPFASRHLSDGLRPLPMPHQNPVAERLREIHRRQSALTSSPWSHDLIDLALAVATSLTVSEDGPPVWMLFIGSPSSGKTDTVLTLKEAAGVYFVDMVTENFLGSVYRDPRTGARAPDVLKDPDGR